MAGDTPSVGTAPANTRVVRHRLDGGLLVLDAHRDYREFWRRLTHIDDAQVFLGSLVGCGDVSVAVRHAGIARLASMANHGDHAGLFDRVEGGSFARDHWCALRIRSARTPASPTHGLAIGLRLTLSGNSPPHTRGDLSITTHAPDSQEDFAREIQLQPSAQICAGPPGQGGLLAPASQLVDGWAAYSRAGRFGRGADGPIGNDGPSAHAGNVQLRTWQRRVKAWRAGRAKEMTLRRLRKPTDMAAEV